MITFAIVMIYGPSALLKPFGTTTNTATTTNTVAVVHENPPGLSNYTEIGWCSIVDGIHYESIGDNIHYVIVSIDNGTKWPLLKLCPVEQAAGYIQYRFADDMTTVLSTNVYVVSYLVSGKRVYSVLEDGARLRPFPNKK